MGLIVAAAWPKILSSGEWFSKLYEKLGAVTRGGEGRETARTVAPLAHIGSGRLPSGARPDSGRLR
jgi:hypothetical protein